MNPINAGYDPNTANVQMPQPQGTPPPQSGMTGMGMSPEQMQMIADMLRQQGGGQAPQDPFSAAIQGLGNGMAMGGQMRGAMG